MRRISYFPSAEDDLENIALYTKESWGERQAARYLSALSNDIERLRTFPDRYPLHTGVHSNLRKMRSGHHVIFYQATTTQVSIVRILHERMDRPVNE